MKKKSKMLIIGIDGGTFELILPMLKRGKLPNFSYLLVNGAAGICESTIPPMTFPAWSTFLTGCNPGQHGIYDFTKFQPNSYKIRFLNARSRKAPTFFQSLSESGLRVAMIGVPTTYPPEPLNGVVISGFDCPVTTSIDPSFVYPRKLFYELKQKFGAFHETGFQEVKIGKDWHAQALEKMRQNLKKRAEISLYLLEKGEWDCFMTLFSQTDTVSHHYWAFQDADSPRYNEAGAKIFSTAIEEIYQLVDNYIGEILEIAGREIPIMVVSDHGFGGAGDRVIFINNWLAKNGFLTFKKFSIAKQICQALRIKAAENLPAKFQQCLFRMFQGRMVSAFEGQSRFGNIDWQTTRVFSDELNYFPRLFINLRGRFPQGIVNPGKEYEDLRAEIIQNIKNWQDPFTINSDPSEIVEKVYRAEEIYSGAYLSEAPDLILELAKPAGYSYVCLPSPVTLAKDTVRKIKPQEFIGSKGRGMNGSHRKEGILILHGFGEKKGSIIKSEQDIAGEKKVGNVNLSNLASFILQNFTLTPLPKMETAKISFRSRAF